MSAPDFASVLRAKWPAFPGEAFIASDGQTSVRMVTVEDVAAALEAEVVAWLGSDVAGVTAGDAICSGHGDGVCFNFDPDVDGPCSRCEADARAALAALATSEGDLR